MKVYVLTIAQQFPSGHPRAGQPTMFQDIVGKNKIHTIRVNYALWEKRFVEIDAGRACLSIRVWTGKPYRSKQEEVLRLDRSHGIGLQRFVFDPPVLLVDTLAYRLKTIAQNDGLWPNDFVNWFINAPSEAMAMIHFTPFRY